MIFAASLIVVLLQGDWVEIGQAEGTLEVKERHNSAKGSDFVFLSVSARDDIALEQTTCAGVNGHSQHTLVSCRIVIHPLDAAPT